MRKQNTHTTGQLAPRGLNFQKKNKQNFSAFSELKNFRFWNFENFIIFQFGKFIQNFPKKIFSIFENRI